MEEEDKALLLNSSESIQVEIQPKRFINVSSINAEYDVINSNSVTATFRKPQKSEPDDFLGSLNVLSAKFESLDYDTCENYIKLEEERSKGYPFVVKKQIARWIVFILIGMITAIIACIIDISIGELAKIKYGTLKKYMNENIANNQLYIPFLYWTLFNIIPVLIGSILVTYVEPVAAGSGIPQVKCYLNGVKIPRVVRIKTLIVKTIGVITSVVGGLAGGKEGPMIHSGAVVAAGISQGKSTTFQKDSNIFKYFREDHEKRDFVAGGAAAGVSAAFGAPLGGVLFALEEGASFWNQSLTWRNLLASIVSAFTLNVILSAYHGHPGQLSYDGLLNLGKFKDLDYTLLELPVFVLMGAMGGLLGALWNHINYKLAVIRIRYIRSFKYLAVIEACLVAAVSAAVGFIMMYSLNYCRPIGQDPKIYYVQLFCQKDEYNTLAAIWFQTPEESVRSFLHDPSGSHQPVAIIVFVICYFLLSCWTFGLNVSLGLFIPSLLTGAAWGRGVGILIAHLFPQCKMDNPGKFALIGAAAQLGGVVRMTISLTAIIMETTGNISFALPLIITLIAAKWTGDFFNEGIYDYYIQLAGVPVLQWEPPPLSSMIYASEVMSHPVVTFKIIENVGHIVEVLKLTSYNGFPVVDPPLSDEDVIKSYGRLRGLILRSQLVVILKQKLFNETSEHWTNNHYMKYDLFRNEYPRYPNIEDIYLTEQEKTFSIDLKPFMNPSPYTVIHSTSLPRMFRLFRCLGLRHLPIVSDMNEVVGMVTRKDLTRYRTWHHHGKMGLEELSISKNL